MTVTRLSLLAAGALFLCGLAPLAAAEPKTAEDYYKAGQTFRAAKQYDKAKDSFETAALLDGRCLKAHVALAWVDNETGDYRGAAAAALTAVLIDSDSADGWRELGYAEYRQGEYSLAKKALQVAVQLNPSDAASRHYLDAVKKQLGEDADTAAKK